MHFGPCRLGDSCIAGSQSEKAIRFCLYDGWCESDGLGRIIWFGMDSAGLGNTRADPWNNNEKLQRIWRADLRSMSQDVHGAFNATIALRSVGELLTCPVIFAKDYGSDGIVKEWPMMVTTVQAAPFPVRTATFYLPRRGGKSFSSFCAPLLSFSWFFSGFLLGSMACWAPPIQTSFFVAGS